MRKILFAFFAITLIIACNKRNDPALENTGVLQPLALDGCTNIIVLDNGTRLEPISNLSGVELQVNKRFSITYRIKPAASICMVGETIEIVSLRYL